MLNLLDAFSTWPPELTPGQAPGTPSGREPWLGAAVNVGWVSPGKHLEMVGLVDVGLSLVRLVYVG